MFQHFFEPRFKLPSYLGNEEKAPLLKHLEQEVPDNTFGNTAFVLVWKCMQ